ncbi:hypothetical protein GW864_02210 [bacterium]|nr:hypothetical protein [bacterium]
MKRSSRGSLDDGFKRNQNSLKHKIIPMQDRNKLIKIFLEKNSQINLSAIRDEEGVRVKHIQDSLELYKVLRLQKHRQVCDV